MNKNIKSNEQIPDKHDTRGERTTNQTDSNPGSTNYNDIKLSSVKTERGLVFQEYDTSGGMTYTLNILNY